MDPSILKVIPLLVQTAAVIGRRTFNVTAKTLAAQARYALASLPVACGELAEPGASPLPDRIESTRAHLRDIAEIFSHETRALESELAAIADDARSLVEDGEDEQTYTRRWRAKY